MEIGVTILNSWEDLSYKLDAHNNTLQAEPTQEIHVLDSPKDNKIIDNNFYNKQFQIAKIAEKLCF